ncbi:plasma alpha-L-fucosidase-like [Bradysia coprophila]|uniref:plasma alpha-L-fucosidase-like n=1 Tax=Bradysia coprophila TaxID=38358 RepID=UPI00187D6EC0|nr:plasma alpha-L-fucosidase-like [Bradysia coprophila]
MIQMHKILRILVCLSLVSICAARKRKIEIDNDIGVNSGHCKFEPTWDSLDSRPIPAWYDEGKVGVKISWGVSSVPGFRNEWFWHSWQGPDPDPKSVEFMKSNYPPRFTYQDFARDFTAEFFDPYKWADIVKSSGAKYVVFTSKHHDGYALYPSTYSFGWNSVDTGPRRDLIEEFSKAIRHKTDIKFGLYHSLYEWFHPLYLKDKERNFSTRQFVHQKVIPEFKELVKLYKPEIIWSDGDWEASDEYWGSLDVLAWLYNSSPVKDTVVVNDRWGNGTSCKHGGVWNCADRYNPMYYMPHKWENAFTIDKYSWSYRRNSHLEDYLSPQEIIDQLVSTVSCGGNFLINVGPTRDGMLAPILTERLLQLGQWLSINGEAIYGTTIWPTAQNDSITEGVWYTYKPAERKIFVIVLQKAFIKTDRQEMVFGSVDSELVPIDNIQLLGQEDIVIIWRSIKNGLSIKFEKNWEGQWATTLVINLSN